MLSYCFKGGICSPSSNVITARELPQRAKPLLPNLNCVTIYYKWIIPDVPVLQESIQRQMTVARTQVCCSLVMNDG